MALPNNFLTEPLVGPGVNGWRSDGVDPTEMINYLFKKSFGIPNAQAYKTYRFDFSGTYNSTQTIKNNFIYAQYIPDTAPSDTIEDTSWSIPQSSRYISQSYPYLVNYRDILMTGLNSDNPSFVCKNSDDTLISNNTIPYYYGDHSSYNIILKGNNNTLLNFGLLSAGSWIMDTDSGILTFYDDVDPTIATVNKDTPPRISYWRYEGLTGNANIVEVFDA